MLVLGRKEDQKIRFPDLGITVQVLRVSGSSVRLGIDAPMEVRVIRDELGEHEPRELSPAQVIRLPQSLRHELRNELNSMSIALHLFKQEIDAGYRENAEATFNKLVSRLENISCSKAFSREGIPVRKGSDLTALLAEDEPNEREMLAGFLRMHGYRVDTAADGQAALEYLESNEQPSVVLVDMRMPRCDGLTAIRRIRENPAFDGTKIFAISGSTPEENRMNVEREGVNGWFMKPLNPKSLVDAMAVTAETVAPTAA